MHLLTETKIIKGRDSNTDLMTNNTRSRSQDNQQYRSSNKSLERSPEIRTLSPGKLGLPQPYQVPQI